MLKRRKRNIIFPYFLKKSHFRRQIMIQHSSLASWVRSDSDDSTWTVRIERNIIIDFMISPFDSIRWIMFRASPSIRNSFHAVDDMIDSNFPESIIIPTEHIATKNANIWNEPNFFLLKHCNQKSIMIIIANFLKWPILIARLSKLCVCSKL